jgi:hypothetical protein
MSDIVERYLATWNATGTERKALLQAHWSPDVTYVDPLAEVTGHDGVDALVDGIHGQFPGFVSTALGDADAHHRQLRFTWGLRPAGDDPVVVGFDVVVLDDEDRIRVVRGFLDKVPD